MEKENKYFEKALHNFISDVAYVKAIRHLYDLGYDNIKIQKNLSYPVSIETIETVILEYEKEAMDPEKNYEIIETVDRLGNKSFIKRKRV